MLGSCETTKTVTKMVKIPTSSEQFSCEIPPEVKLPSDEELRTWTNSDLFVWGTNNFFWGERCKKKLTDLREYIDCFNDDKCTSIIKE